MSSPSTEIQREAPPRPGLVIFAVCLAVLVVPLGLSGPPVALPAIGQDLNADIASLQWVVNAYNVMAASFMMACGSIADLIGRKRVFAFGVGLYAVTGLVAAFANHIAVLYVARGVSGLAAAAVMTAGAAALAAMFHGAARVKAFALIGVTIGAGLALGPATSGVLVDAFGWRSVFLVHTALAGISLLGFRFVEESRNPNANRVDWLGTVTFTLALFFFTLGVVQGPQWGWGSTAVLGLLAAAVLLILAFVAVERRQQQPMFDLSLFRQRRFMGINLLATAVSFGFVGLLVLLPSYLIAANGVSDRTAGLTMLLLTAPIVVFPLLAGRLVGYGVSARSVLSVSLIITAIGCGWLTIVHPGISSLGLLGPLLTVGIGIGLIYGLMDGAAVSTVEPARVGMAVGMFNTVRLATEAIAVAVMLAALVSAVQARLLDGLARFVSPGDGDAGEIANSLTSGNLTAPAGQVPENARDGFVAFLAESYTDGLRLVLWGVVAICAVSAVALYVLLRDRTNQPDPVDGSTGPDGAANKVDTDDQTDSVKQLGEHTEIRQR